MNTFRLFFTCFAAATAALLIGCTADDPDRTGDDASGIGAPGVNAPNAPQTQEEARKQQMEQEAAFRKSHKR